MPIISSWPCFWRARRWEGPRVPEQRSRPRRMKLAMMAILLHPLLILAGGRSLRGNRGGPDNGQSRPAWLLRDPLRVQLRLRRTGPDSRAWATTRPRGTLPPALSCRWAGSRRCAADRAAGSMAVKKRVPQTAGTLRTYNFTFFGMLAGTVFLGVALSFMPALVLGPVANHLTAIEAQGGCGGSDQSRSTATTGPGPTTGVCPTIIERSREEEVFMSVDNRILTPANHGRGSGLQVEATPRGAAERLRSDVVRQATARRSSCSTRGAL